MLQDWSHTKTLELDVTTNFALITALKTKAEHDLGLTDQTSRT